jgi:hypothetical protein
MNGDDRDLYEAFQALRREEEAGVPRFALPAVAAHGRYPLAVATACLIAVLAAALWLMPGHHARSGRPERAAASITSWTPPTDFLLKTPGRELVEGVPSIGEWQGMAVVAEPGGHRAIAKQGLRSRFGSAQEQGVSQRLNPR